MPYAVGTATDRLTNKGAVIAPHQCPACGLFEVHWGAQAGVDIWAAAD